MDIDWIEQRFKESRGFVSKRIAQTVLMIHQFLYGESFVIQYQKFVRVLDPEQEIISKPTGFYNI